MGWSLWTKTMSNCLQHGGNYQPDCLFCNPVIMYSKPIPPIARNPWSTQEGGSHYKDLPIQPFEYSMKNKLDPLQHTIIKYVTRFRDKGKIADLEKAKHCIDLLIEWESRNG